MISLNKKETHANNSKIFLADKTRSDWFNKGIWYQRNKRDTAIKQIDEWEVLRQLASQIKDHTLSKLDVYLEQFEKQAKENGLIVHWAENADEHNNITLQILNKHKIKKIVKSKSMLTEECGLNEFLEDKGVEIIDTDLGERIIQLAEEKPSHIVMPAIHKNRDEIGELFYDKLKTKKSNDPIYLTSEARLHLREKFINSEASISGVNFAIAETGSFVICTNEGNADLGMTANSKVHIASMGIEKILPKQEHLGIFIRMLARNATGQPITTYTSHFTKPLNGGETHIIIVDNKRTKILSSEHFTSSLKCIRCAACMNTCPVYRNSGGHSYNYVIPGPIGAVLAPHYDIKKYGDLPFASTLCGSCTNVCPVKIDLDGLLYKWRQVITEDKKGLSMKSVIMKSAAFALNHAQVYKVMGRTAAFFINNFRSIVTKATPWGSGRELPDVPQQSFKKWYKKEAKKNEDKR